MKENGKNIINGDPVFGTNPITPPLEPKTKLNRAKLVGCLIILTAMFSTILAIGCLIQTVNRSL